MRKCLLSLLITMLPIPAFAQSTVVTSLPRPTPDATLVQAPPPPGALIPPPSVPDGPPTTPVEVFTRPERRFSFSIESDLFFPVFHQHLQAPITVPGFYNDTAQLPGADLGLAGALAFSVRTKAFGGEIGVTYRWLGSEGRDHLSGFDPTGDVPWRSRLDMHHIDIDYFSRAYERTPMQISPGESLVAGSTWTLHWNAGARIASIFYDTEAAGPIFDRHISNFFIGAGPHAGLDLTRTLGNSGLAVFGRIDGGAVIGGIHQQFSDTVFDNNGNGIGFGYTSQRGTQGVPVLMVQIGLGAAPWNGAWGQWQIGYQFEQWWNLGNAGASSADLVNQGMYARWVFRY